MSSNDTKFFGHPKSLFSLFATEMWERFNYYGMRALLVTFLTGTLISGGFGLSENEALAIYGLFTGLVYVTPILGGLLADKLLGQRKTIYIGALTMGIGQICIAYSATISGVDAMEFKQMVFNYGLGVLILGNGFFKPNISTMVGELYSEGDVRRDSAFTIFYMGINIGAMLGPFITGLLLVHGWEYGFLAAAVGMFIGFGWFMFSRKSFGTIGMPPKYKDTQKLFLNKDNLDVVMYVVGIVVSIFVVLYVWAILPSIMHTIIPIIIGVFGVGYLGLSIIKNTKGSNEWSRIGVILVLALFNVVFWAGYEQAGGTLNLFINSSVDRTIGGWEIPTAWFQSIPAVFVVGFAPVFTILWVFLDRLKMNPNTPMKFGWGIALLAIGFVIIAIAAERTQAGTVKVSPMWVVLLFVMHTWGELCLSPIGLSMITKLSPIKLVSTMMGIWMGSIAGANYLAASMKKIAEHFDVPLFWFIAGVAGVASLLVFALSPWLKKMMKGVA